MSWFYLALLAPLLYAVINLMDDNLLQFVYKSPYLSTVSAGFYGALPLLTRFFIHAPAIPPDLAILAFASGFLTLAYYFFYFVALGEEVPSIVVALFALAPATIPFLAHFIVHEHLTLMEITGLIIVLFASLGLAVTDVKKFKFSGALLPMLLAVLFIDITAISTKYVYQRVDFYPAYMYFSAGMGAGGVCFFFLKYRENKENIIQISKAIKKLLPVFITAELIGLAAEFTKNLAVSRGPVSLVEVMDGIQPMYVLLIALALYPVAPKYFREAERSGFTTKLALMLIIILGLGVIGVSAKV